jgi:hypothetical protein
METTMPKLSRIKAGDKFILSGYTYTAKSDARVVNFGQSVFVNATRPNGQMPSGSEMADVLEPNDPWVDLAEISNEAGQTFAVGKRVRHGDGWEGTIIGIRETQMANLLLVQPDDKEQLRGYDREYATDAGRYGRSTYCRPRDQGRSMGNYTPIN